MSGLDLATLLVKIDADISGLQNGLDSAQNASNEAAKSFGDSWNAVGIQLKEIGSSMTDKISKPVMDTFKQCVEAAGDFTETLSKTEVVFGSMFNEVVKWSESAIENMGIAQATALEMTSLYGDMATGMGMGQQAAADMSMSLTQLAADLASFKNISVEQAGKALQGIFTGESQSLKTLGIIMNETTLSAYAMANGFGESFSKLSEQEKIMVRYGYVMQATSSAQGDFARTSDSLSNQQKQLGERLKELSTVIGSRLEPIFTRVLTAINSVVQWVTNLNPAIQTIAIGIAGVVAAAGPLITIIGMLATTLPVVLATISAFAAPVAIAVGAIAAITAGIVAFTNSTTAAKEKNEELRKSLAQEIAGKVKLDKDKNFDANAEDAKKKIKEIPDEKTTKVKLDKKDPSTWDAPVNEIKNKLNEIKDKTYVVSIKENASNGAEVEAAEAKLEELKGYFEELDVIAETSLGFIVLSDNTLSSLTEAGKAIAGIATNTGKVSEQVDTLKKSIEGYYKEQVTKIQETYDLLIMNYIAMASANGESWEVIGTQVNRLYGEQKRLTDLTGEQKDAYLEMVGLLADGIQEDDLPAINELIKAFPDLLGYVKLSDEELTAMLTNAAQQPEAAKVAFDMLTQSMVEQQNELSGELLSAYETYQQTIKDAAKAQEQLPSIFEETANAYENAANYLQTYVDYLADGMTEEEAFAQVSKDMTNDLGEDATAAIEALSNGIYDYLEITEDGFVNVYEAQEQMNQKSQSAWQAYYAMLNNEPIKNWSEEAKQLYIETMEALGIAVDENGSASQAAIESFYESLGALSETYMNGDNEAWEAYCKAHPDALDSATAEMLNSNQAFWDEYNKQVEDGTVGTEKGMQKLIAAMNKPEEAHEAGKETGEELAQGVEDGVNETTVEAEVKTDVTATTDNVDTTEVEEKTTEAVEDAKPEPVEQTVETVTTTEETGTPAEDYVESVKEELDSQPEIETTLSISTESWQTAGVEAGQAFATAVGASIQGNQNVIVTAVNNLINTVARQTTQIKSNGQKLAKALIDGIKAGVNNNASQVKTAVQSAISKVSSLTSTATSNGKSIGTALIDGMISGLNNKSGTLYTTIENIVKNAIDKAKKAADVNSPSKKMRDLVGAPLVEGLVVGMNKEAPNAYATIETIVDKLITSGKSTMDLGVARSTSPISTREEYGTTNITQNNTFTTRELTPYETQMEINKLNKDLAKSFKR